MAADKRRLTLIKPLLSICVHPRSSAAPYFPQLLTVAAQNRALAYRVLPERWMLGVSMHEVDLVLFRTELFPSGRANQTEQATFG
jgi:hypothetical protein